MNNSLLPLKKFWFLHTKWDLPPNKRVFECKEDAVDFLKKLLKETNYNYRTALNKNGFPANEKDVQEHLYSSVTLLEIDDTSSLRKLFKEVEE